MKKKNKLIPLVYAGLFLFFILFILLENSYLLINQTTTNITETSWLDSEKLISSIVAGAKQSIESVQLTEQQIQRHIKKSGGQIDRLLRESKVRPDDELRDILRHFKILSIAVLDSEGRTVYSLNRESLPADARHFNPADGSTPMDRIYAQNRDSILFGRGIIWETDISKDDPDLQIMSIPRQRQTGRIRLFYSSEKLQEIRARIGLQLLISSLEAQNVIQKISFLNDQLMIIADYEPSRINMIEEKLEYWESLNTGITYQHYDPVKETMVWVHPILYAEDTRGVCRITIRRPGIKQIFSNTANITIINSIIIMLVATISTVVMLIFHRRNMTRMEAMEKQISENEKLVSLANLTAGVAHEVRNPLNSISITIQRLQMEFVPSIKQERDDYMILTATMKNEVDRINTIITDFLDFAKPFSPNSKCFNLDDFINENVSFFSGEAKKSNITIHTQVATNGTQFYGDREKLTQVLINLFFNALEATPEKGTISIYSEITRDHCWQLKIQDSGEGIPDHNINRIFDIYFTTKKSGSGLGLYISRKIVQAHDGTIDLQSSPIKGTTAVVTMPLKPC